MLSETIYYNVTLVKSNKFAHNQVTYFQETYYIAFDLS